MRIQRKLANLENHLANKAGQFILGHDQKRAVSDNSLSKIGQAFSKIGIHQVTFPHLTHSEGNNSSGLKYIRNTNNSENAGLLRRLTRFRGQESRARFMKIAIKKLDNDNLLNELAAIMTRKRFFDDRSQNPKSYRLLESENYMPVLAQAIKFNKPAVFRILLENKRSFTDREENTLKSLIAKQADSKELQAIFDGRFL